MTNLPVEYQVNASTKQQALDVIDEELNLVSGTIVPQSQTGDSFAIGTA